MINLPDPDLQIAFSERLSKARTEFLQEAVLNAVSRCDVSVLDDQVHDLVPANALQVMAARGLLAELAFAIPAIIRTNPRLLGYYRLLLGFSQKAFYHQSTGLSPFRRAEDSGVLTTEADSNLRELCVALNRSCAFLVLGIADTLSKMHLDDFTLLTFGPQLRGSRNVSLGAAAVHLVFEAIREIVGDRAATIEDRLISFQDATGRRLEVRFGSDPDIEVVSVNQDTGDQYPLLAIEVKGGTDRSNAHNRLGEAEKSHLKAKSERGFTDLWTVVNVRGLSEPVRRRASPTTTAFFDLVDIAERQGAAYQAFRDRLLQRLRLPA